VGLAYEKVERLMDYLYLPALLALICITLAGIFYHDFDDNLMQRIGLAVTCFGAVMRLGTLLSGHDLVPPRDILTMGSSLFAIGTAYKFWRKKK
jgi:hypothetical protein